jgi:hypothetical protein
MYDSQRTNGEQSPRWYQDLATNDERALDPNVGSWPAKALDLHGRRGAQLAAASHCAAISDIERIVRDEAIACGFRRLPGYLFSVKSGRAGARSFCASARQRNARG